MEFDVFLSGSKDDDTEHLLPLFERLESRGYRVCYHVRDFVPGELVTTNIGNAVEKSKRTVCLLTENFIRRSAINMYYFSGSCLRVLFKMFSAV
jgi:protein toll